MGEFDQDKVDDVTLALLWLTTHSDDFGHRAWKSFDWDTMDRLYQKGFIGSPKGKAKSVALTDQGAERAKQLFEQMFSVSSQSRGSGD